MIGVDSPMVLSRHFRWHLICQTRGDSADRAGPTKGTGFASLSRVRTFATCSLRVARIPGPETPDELSEPTRIERAEWICLVPEGETELLGRVERVQPDLRTRDASLPL